MEKRKFTPWHPGELVVEPGCTHEFYQFNHPLSRLFLVVLDNKISLMAADAAASAKERK